MSIHVALLRAINVGGRSQVAMSDLRAGLGRWDSPARNRCSSAATWSSRAIGGRELNWNACWKSIVLKLAALCE